MTPASIQTHFFLGSWVRMFLSFPSCRAGQNSSLPGGGID
jgi:hypothetical protein